MGKRKLDKSITAETVNNKKLSVQEQRERGRLYANENFSPLASSTVNNKKVSVQEQRERARRSADENLISDKISPLASPKVIALKEQQEKTHLNEGLITHTELKGKEQREIVHSQEKLEAKASAKKKMDYDIEINKNRKQINKEEKYLSSEVKYFIDERKEKSYLVEKEVEKEVVEKKFDFPEKKQVKEENKKLRYLFNSIDVNGDESIDNFELLVALNKVGFSGNPKDVMMLMKEADINNDGRLDFKEFEKIMNCVDKSSLWYKVSDSFYSKYFESHAVETLQVADSLLESSREIIKNNSKFIVHKHYLDNVVLQAPSPIIRVLAYIFGNMFSIIFIIPLFWPVLFIITANGQEVGHYLFGLQLVDSTGRPATFMMVILKQSIFSVLIVGTVSLFPVIEFFSLLIFGETLLNKLLGLTTVIKINRAVEKKETSFFMMIMFFIGFCFLVFISFCMFVFIAENFKNYPSIISTYKFPSHMRNWLH